MICSRIIKIVTWIQGEELRVKSWMGENVIRISVIRYSGIIVCAGGCVRPLIDMILSPVIANDHAIMRAGE